MPAAVPGLSKESASGYPKMPQMHVSFPRWSRVITFFHVRCLFDDFFVLSFSMSVCLCLCLQRRRRRLQEQCSHNHCMLVPVPLLATPLPAKAHAHRHNKTENRSKPMQNHQTDQKQVRKRRLLWATAQRKHASVAVGVS